MAEQDANPTQQLSIPEERTTSLALLTLFVSINIVQVTVYWLTEEGPHRTIPFTCVDGYELFLMLASFCFMVTFLFNLQNVNLIEEQEIRGTFSMSVSVNRSWLSRFNQVIPLRTVIYILLGLCSVVNPMFQCIKYLSCFHYGIPFADALHVSTNIVQIVFCLFQTIFLLKFKTWKCKSPYMRHFLSVIVATNMSLCIKVLVEVVGVPLTKAAGNSTSSFNDSSINVGSDRRTFSEKCETHTTTINEIIDDTYSHFYSFVVEYCIFSTCILGTMWNISAFNDTEEDAALSSANSFNAPDERTPLLGPEARNRSRCRTWLTSTITFISKYSFWFSSTFCLAILISHIVLTIKKTNTSKDDTNDGNKYDIDIWVIQTLYTYNFCIVALIGYVLGRSVGANRGIYGRDEIVLFISAIGHLVLILFETIEVISDLSKTSNWSDVFLLLKTFCHYIGLYCQTMLLVKFLRLTPNYYTHSHMQYVRGILVFLGICNAERWVVDTFLPPVVDEYVKLNSKAVILGKNDWWFITHTTYPFVILHRLYSSLLCFEIVISIPLCENNIC